MGVDKKKVNKQLYQGNLLFVYIYEIKIAFKTCLKLIFLYLYLNKI